MMKKLSVLALIVLTCAVAMAQNAIPYKTGFDVADGWVNDKSINDYDGWAVLSQGADAKITNTFKQAGDQSVALEANSQIDKPLSAKPAETIVWMEGYFSGEGTDAEPSFPADPAASAIVFFSKTNGIQCLNGNGSGGGSWVATGVSLVKDQWYKISIRQDYTAKTWKCFVDGVQTPAQDLGFRDNVTTLHGFRNFADTPSWLDTFRVIPVSKGDANMDSKIDAADVVTLVSDPNGSGITDLIQKDNADVDGSGAISNADLTALVNKILAK